MMAWRTAPESPENVEMTSLEKLVPEAGLEYPMTSMVDALTAVSASTMPIAAGAPTVMPNDLPTGALNALARAWLARAVYWNSRCPASLPYTSQHTKQSYIHYVTGKRLERAKLMLTHTDKPVLRIATELDFQPVNYFSRTFKKHTGLTPSEYRQQRATSSA